MAYAEDLVDDLVDHKSSLLITQQDLQDLDQISHNIQNIYGITPDY